MPTPWCDTSVAASVISTYLCPSDIPELVAEYQQYRFGGNSYLGSAGRRSYFISDLTFDGILYYNSKVRMKDIKDGTSKTILLGERYSFDPEYPDLKNRRGWAWNNVFAGQDVLGGVYEPVNYQLPTGVGPNPSNTLKNKKLSSYSSAHTGGANFCFADGSVRFLTLTSTADLITLERLAIKDDGLIIEEFEVDNERLATDMTAPTLAKRIITLLASQLNGLLPDGLRREDSRYRPGGWYGDAQ